MSDCVEIKCSEYQSIERDDVDAILSAPPSPNFQAILEKAAATIKAAASLQRPPLTEEERLEYIHSKWGGTLKKLAES